MSSSLNKILLTVLSLLVISWLLNMKKSEHDKTLRVGVHLDQLHLPIDPSENPNLVNAFFSNNLYSNLIDVDENNNYTLELVSKYWFEAERRRLVFEFQGSRVTAADAEFTLKRLIIRNKQLHSNLWNLICAENESPNYCSKRIFVENDKLIIYYDNENNAKYIIPTLASVDYKIVPILSFDNHDYATSKIINYTKTSGYYHLDIRNSRYFFVRNDKVRSDIYKEYELVNFNKAASFDNKKKNLIDELDIISTTVPSQFINRINLLERKWTFFDTHNINIFLLIFNKSAFKKTTFQQRFSYAARFFEKSKQLIKISSEQSTIEFFQDFGQGFLNESQKKEIQILRNNLIDVSKVKMTFGTMFSKNWENFSEENPSIKIVKLDTFPFNLKVENRPDSYIVSNDVSFDLSLSLISYAANMGLLDMSKDDLSMFSNLKTEEEKIKFINEIHFKTLKECMIYPMWSSPYTTAFKGDHFKHNLSKFNSRTLLWKIH